MLTRFATGLLALAAGTIAHDAMAADAKFTQGRAPEPDSVLGDTRGGFVTVGGVTLDIGITTATYINGKLALATTVATGPTGPTAPTAPTAPTVNAPKVTIAATQTPATPQPPSPGGGSGPTGASQTTTPPTVTTPQIQTQTQGPTTTNTPAPSGSGGSGSIGALAGSGTVSTNGTVTTTTNDGQTTVIQNPSQVINAVVNAANDQSIRLDTQVNVVLPGFDAAQRSALLTSMGMKMGADGAFGIVSSLPH